MQSRKDFRRFLNDSTRKKKGDLPAWKRGNLYWGEDLSKTLGEKVRLKLIGEKKPKGRVGGRVPDSGGEGVYKDEGEGGSLLPIESSIPWRSLGLPNAGSEGLEVAQKGKGLACWESPY